jgi:cobalamin biosynthesis protein CbiG
VKDMRESMGLHEPRIEELASRKLQHNDPKLYSEHDKFKAHLRAIENEKSKKEREKKLTKKAKKSLTLAKSSPL